MGLPPRNYSLDVPNSPEWEDWINDRGRHAPSAEEVAQNDADYRAAKFALKRTYLSGTWIHDGPSDEEVAQKAALAALGVNDAEPGNTSPETS